jgi:translation initiation factor IF-3
MDYGKFKYEAAQKAKEARKNQANTILKEVRFRLKIDTHDYETKRKRAESFLKAGDKVKAMILFRGREQSRPEQGVRLLQRFAEDVADYGVVEFTPMIDGRNMVMIIAPLKTKAEAKAEALKSSKKTPVRDVVEEEKPASEPAEKPAAEVTTTTTAAKPAAKAAAKPAAKAPATKTPAKPAAKAAAKPAAKASAKTTTQKEENNA